MNYEDNTYVKTPRRIMRWVRTCAYFCREYELVWTNEERQELREMIVSELAKAVVEGYDDTAQYLNHILDDLYRQLAASEFPTLREAAKLIAYDNGMVNRTTTEDEAVHEMMTRVLTNCSRQDLEAAEAELSKLTTTQLSAACCGEEGELCSIVANGVLNTLFEEQ